MKENIGISEEIENEFEIKKWWELKIDKNYEYIPKNELFQLASNVLYYGIAFPILTFLIKIIYQLEIEGKQYLEELKGAAITVSNHVLVLDCAMVGIACMEKKCFLQLKKKVFKYRL